MSLYSHVYCPLHGTHCTVFLLHCKIKWMFGLWIPCSLCVWYSVCVRYGWGLGWGGSDIKTLSFVQVQSWPSSGSDELKLAWSWNSRSLPGVGTWRLMRCQRHVCCALAVKDCVCRVSVICCCADCSLVDRKVCIYIYIYTCVCVQCSSRHSTWKQCINNPIPPFCLM